MCVLPCKCNPMIPRNLFAFLLMGCLCLGMPFSGFAQECGTTYQPDPYFDRDAYESYFREFSQQKVTRDVIWLPIQFNIIRHTDGTGGLDPLLIDGILSSANVNFAPAGIQFYSCGGPRFIDENFLYDFDRAKYQDSLQARTTDNAINIFFINKVLNNASFICGYASFPWVDRTHVVVENRCALNGSTFSHELGHYFGLLHTHETANGIEVVERSNCLFAGDELCDTPADPRLTGGVVNLNCEYVGTAKDQNGKSYEPDPRNIMSYSRKECRDVFTEEQYARMSFYYERDRQDQLTCVATTPRNPDLGQDVRLNIFPNPGKNQLNLEMDHAYIGPISLTLVDLHGKEVFKWEGNKEFDLWQENWELPTMVSGVYTIKLQMGERQVFRAWIHN